MIPEFLKKYFFDPILHEEGYNIVNTTAYALLFVAVGFICYRELRRHNIRIDATFLRAVAPFVLVGGVFRAMQDMKVFSLYLGGSWIQYLFVTPLIYFSVMFLCILSLFVSRTVLKDDYWKGTTAFCVFVFLVGVTLLWVNATRIEWSALLLIPLFVFLSTALMFYVGKRLSWDFITKNSWVIAGQMFDASSTAFGLYSYGYIEQHVIPEMLIRLAKTPFVFFPLKMLVVGGVLYILRDEKEEELKNFILLLVFILGAAPGLRDFLRIFFST